MDNLERYIKENREAMDIHDPDPSTWEKIEKDLQVHHTPFRQYLWRAAVILIIAGAGFVLTYRSLSSPQGEEKSAMTIVSETEQYYNSLIRSLYSQAEPMLTANPDIHTELRIGMNELDSLYINIKKDLKDNVATEEVVEAMIVNYRLRIELLEDMLRIMNEEKTENENKTGYEL